MSVMVILAAAALSTGVPELEHSLRPVPDASAPRWQFEGREWTGEIADGFSADEVQNLSPEDVRKIRGVPDGPPNPNAERDDRMGKLLAEAYVGRQLRDIPTDVLIRLNPADLEEARERRRKQIAEAAAQRPRPKTERDRRIEELIERGQNLPALDLRADLSSELAAEQRAIASETKRRAEEVQQTENFLRGALAATLALAVLAVAASLYWLIRRRFVHV